MSYGPCCVCWNDANHPIFFKDASDTPKMVCMTCANEIYQKYVSAADDSEIKP